MPQIGLDVKSEYGIMTDVLLATVRNFVPTPPINRTQEVYFPNNPPILSRLTDEQNTFAATLEQNGVTVHWAKEIQECPYQVNTRDLGAVIGNTFLIGN